MNNRPTPETDAFAKQQYIKMLASSYEEADVLTEALEETENHARKLERERDEARHEAGFWHKLYKQFSIWEETK